jgi:hypothetical protein
LKTSDIALLANIFAELVVNLVVVSLLLALLMGSIKFDAQVLSLLAGLVTLQINIEKGRHRGSKVKDQRNKQRFSKK